MKNILFVLFTIILCGSCTNKARINQLIFDDNLANAYINGESFSGEAWSEDGKTICITCEEGKVISVRVFHENGNMAMNGTSLVGESAVYDEDGNSMQLQDFIKGYPQLVIAIQRMVEELYCASFSEDSTMIHSDSIP